MIFFCNRSYFSGILFSTDLSATLNPLDARIELLQFVLTVCQFDDLTMHSFISKQYMEKHEKINTLPQFTVINFDHSFGDGYIHSNGMLLS